MDGSQDENEEEGGFLGMTAQRTSELGRRRGRIEGRKGRDAKG